MRTLLPSLLLAGILFGTACGTGTSDAAMDAANADLPQVVFTDLDGHHMPLLVETPADGPEPTLLWKDEIGKLLVRCGDRLAVEIYEAPADMGRIKADLDRDLLRRNTIVEEGPDLLVYRSEFPDDTTLVFHHFNRSITVGDRVFQVEDAQEDGTAYTLEEVRNMALMVRPKPAI